MILEFERPISLAASTARFNRWGPDPVNVVVDGAFHRVIRSNGALTPYRVRQNAAATLELDGSDDAERDLRWRLAEALPWQPVANRVTNDERLAALFSRRPGYRPPMEPDPFEALVQAITAQQVNLQWATTTRRRLVERFTDPVAAFGLELRPFPSPAEFAGAVPSDLREMQFTWRKSEFILDLAAHAMAGDLDDLATQSNEAVVAALTAIRGIGRWSAEWVLARCLARPDAIAAGDLGVRKAVSYFWEDSPDLLSEQQVREAAADWGDATNWITHLLLERLADS